MPTYEDVDFIRCGSVGDEWSCSIESNQFTSGDPSTEVVTVDDVEIAGPTSPLQEFSTTLGAGWTIALERGGATCEIVDVDGDDLLTCE